MPLPLSATVSAWLVLHLAVLGIAVHLTGPAGSGGRGRAAARRARRVRRHPRRAGWDDVRALLAPGLAPYASAHVCGELRARGVPPGLAHTWAARHGVDLLALAVAAGLGADDLRRYRDSVAELDLGSLLLLAELHRSPLVRVRAVGAAGPHPWSREPAATPPPE